MREKICLLLVRFIMAHLLYVCKLLSVFKKKTNGFKNAYNFSMKRGQDRLFSPFEKRDRG